jgi:hypothetical protein
MLPIDWIRKGPFPECRTYLRTLPLGTRRLLWRLALNEVNHTTSLLGGHWPSQGVPRDLLPKVTQAVL